jgi:DNA-binding transcriptional regulator YiaG
MPNHPNRSRRASPAANPTPDEIRAARASAGLTQTEAARLIYCTLRAWQDWEAGKRRMHPALWELWLEKENRLRTQQSQRRPDQR